MIDERPSRHSEHLAEAMRPVGMPSSGVRLRGPERDFHENGMEIGHRPTMIQVATGEPRPTPAKDIR